jgi:hypothetical protein
MHRCEFEGQLTELRAAVLNVVEHHFAQRKYSFDVVQFLEASEVNLDQILREAFFVGAEVFPISQE